MVTDIEPTDVRLANPDLPAWFAGLTRRLLAKDPAARFPTASEVAGIRGAGFARPAMAGTWRRPPRTLSIM